MKGTYKGIYKYNKHPDAQHVNNGTLFTLIITHQDGTAFKGTVTDDMESGGTRGEGIIQGTIKNGRIEFIKQMPVMTVMTKHGVRVEIEKKHSPIYYSGILNENVFRGSWKIKSGVIINTFIIAFRTGTEGTWQMTKEE